MDEHTVTGLQIRSVLFQFESERLFGCENSRPANRAESLYAKLQAAVIQQIRNFLIRTPPFALHQTREAAEIFQCRRVLMRNV